MNKLNEAEGEAAETQVWLGFALECDYITKEEQVELDEFYDHIVRMLVRMILDSEPWILPRARRTSTD